MGHFSDLRVILEGSWFSLIRRSYEWKALYDELPSEESWVWEYYGNSDSYGVKD